MYRFVMCAIFHFAIAFGVLLSQEKDLNEFLGIPWTSSASSAKSIMLKRPNVTFDAKNSDSVSLFFDGGTFAGQPVSFFQLIFSKEGFHTAKVFLKKTLESKVISRYREACDLIAEKYGKPDHDFYMFDSPYYDGDGYETQAIRLGKATVSSYWKFPVDGKKDNILGVSIAEDLYVTIVYQNGEMISRVIRDHKAKDKDDL